MKNLITLLMLCMIPLVFVNCRGEDDGDDEDNEVEELVGNPGNPRFNLQFNNQSNVDLDLYVKTPSGKVLYYANTSGDGGKLDVDCLCNDCPSGPNENIYWLDGTAPSGKYEFWVQYYGTCGTVTNKTSDFTVRLVKNNQVLQKYTGSLNTVGQKSTIWSHNQ